VFLRAWADRLHEVADDEQPRGQAVEFGTSWTFEFIQTLMRGLVTRFTEEREAWVRSSVAVRSEIVSSILSGAPVEPDAASKRLRYQLGGQHLGYVVWCEQDGGAGEAAGELERVAVALAAAMGAPNPLVVPLGGQLVAAWISSPRRPVLTALPADLHNPASAQAAFGASARGVPGFGETHRDAMHARRVARLGGQRASTVTRFDDIGLTALATVDMDLASRFVNAQLGPLAAQDESTLRLSSTLRVYLEEQASPRRAAQRLGVHENTVKARMRTISGMLPVPPTERPAELLVALRLAKLTAPPKVASTD
jgi:DNA-binding PucR family transcriptional regulator